MEFRLDKSQSNYNLEKYDIFVIQLERGFLYKCQITDGSNGI